MAARDVPGPESPCRGWGACPTYDWPGHYMGSPKQLDTGHIEELNFCPKTPLPVTGTPEPERPRILSLPQALPSPSAESTWEINPGGKPGGREKTALQLPQGCVPGEGGGQG